jgi:hypothetical protein
MAASQWAANDKTSPLQAVSKMSAFSPSKPSQTRTEYESPERVMLNSTSLAYSSAFDQVPTIKSRFGFGFSLRVNFMEWMENA